MTHHSDKIEENKKLVLNFQMAVAKKLQGESQTEIENYLSDDICWHLPTSMAQLADGHKKQGKIQVLELFDSIVKRFYQPTTMQFDFHGVLANDDKVHFHFTLTAITNTKKTYTSGYQMLFKVVDNKVAEVWEYFDSALLLECCQE